MISHFYRVIAALLAGLVVAGTAGCVPISAPMGPGLVSISKTGDELIIALCRGGEIREVRGSYRLRAPGSEWEEFLVLAGSQESVREDVVFPPTSEGLGVVHLKQIDLEQRMDISVLVIGEFETQNYLGSFRLESHSLKEGEWFHTDGTSTKETCV